MRTGVILAGGASRRFANGDKAVASLDGTPMVRHVADRVDRVVDEVVLNCRPDQREDLESAMTGFEGRFRFALDEYPLEGPLAGLLAALEVADGDTVAVVACDMPLVEPAVLSLLFGTLSPQGCNSSGSSSPGDAAVPTIEDHPQPTQAVYRREPALTAIHRAYEAGERRLSALFDRLDVRWVDGRTISRVGTTRSFVNVNTRSALERLERSLDGYSASAARSDSIERPP